MARIVVETQVTNLFDEEKSIRCGMLVRYRVAGALILPAAWKERLGEFMRSETCSRCSWPYREVLEGEACWPVEIVIEGFRPVANEVIFGQMEGEDDEGYEPLLGYVILEQAQAAVDLVANRLVPVKYIDMK